MNGKDMAGNLLFTFSCSFMVKKRVASCQPSDDRQILLFYHAVEIHNFLLQLVMQLFKLTQTTNKLMCTVTCF